MAIGLSWRAVLSVLFPLLTLLTGCARVAQPDGPLAVRDTGEGMPIVLLHGMGDSSLGWRAVESDLVAHGYCVIAWDALGAGDSPKPRRGDYSIPAHAARLDALLAEKQLRDVVLVGHSLGGATALVYTQQHPERVRRLILINPAAYREGAMKRRWLWSTPLLAESVLGLMPRTMLVRMALEMNFHNDDMITDDLQKNFLIQARKPGAIRAFIAQERALVPKDIDRLEQGHASITVPTLILWGTGDEILPMTQGERLVDDMPYARLVRLDGVGHSPHLEAPGRVVEQVIGFAAAK